MAVKVLELLFGSWTGLLSLSTVVFVIVMAAFPYVFITKHMNEPTE